MTTDPKSLRQSFKARARKKPYADLALELSANDIAMLSVAQILRHITFVRDEDALAPLSQDDRDTVRARLRAGIINNADLRTWYEGEWKRISASAHWHVPFVWKGSPRGLAARRATALDDVYRDTGAIDFFVVREVLNESLRELYARAGIAMPHSWRQRRMEEALFPRDYGLRPLFRHYGTSSDVLKFRDHVRMAFGQLPDYLRSFVKQTGHNMRVGERLADIEPNYGIDGPSYARGATYEHTAMGVYKHELLSVDLPRIMRRFEPAEGSPETYLTFDRPDELIKTLAHEKAHGVSSLMDNISYLPLVTKAYAEDLLAIGSKLHAKQRKSIGYYLPRAQDGVHGFLADAREEALVETMAERMMAQINRPSTEIGEYFPKTSRVSSHVLQMLRLDYRMFPQGMEFPWGPAVKAQLAPITRSPVVGATVRYTA